MERNPPDMPDDSSKHKRILFVDDDAALLEQFKEIFSVLSDGAWDIHTAQNHAQALGLIQKQQRMDLIVLDIGMPVVDGVQFLRLLNRAHPGQQVVMLTGLANESKRKECLELGALLCLEKPTEPGGYESIYAALDAVASSGGGTGFRGMMRQVGLQEVLQMECLGTKSSTLEIVTGRTRGLIYICDGAIIHAEKANLRGELALNSLLSLRGGEFNLLPFAEPPERTIQGQWEMLLMEAARLQDEKSGEDGAAIEDSEESNSEPAAPETSRPEKPAPVAPAALDSFPDLFKPASAKAEPARVTPAKVETPKQKPVALDSFPDMFKPPQAKPASPVAPEPAPVAPVPDAAPDAMPDIFRFGDNTPYTPAQTTVAEIEPTQETAPVQIEEVLLCSGTGEVLHEWQCKSAEQRLALLELAGLHGAQIAAAGMFGRFERLEIRTKEDRSLCQVRLDRRLFVRSTRGDA